MIEREENGWHYAVMQTIAEMSIYKKMGKFADTSIITVLSFIDSQNESLMIFPTDSTKANQMEYALCYVMTASGKQIRPMSGHY